MRTEHLFVGFLLIAAGVSACAAAPPAEDVAETCPELRAPDAPGRLSVREYVNSVQYVLGLDASKLVTFLAQDATESGFDNAAPELAVSLEHIRGFHIVAEKLAAQFVESDPSKTGRLPCDPGDENASDCRERVVDALGLSLFRRPLDAWERKRLLAMANDDSTGVPGYQLMLEAMLVSPQFLLQLERVSPSDPADQTGPECADREALDGYSLATKLSFGLTETPPSEDLLAAAAEGELSSSDGVSRWARQLLRSSLARESRRNFADQWLRVNELSGVELDPDVHAGFSTELRDAAARELLRLSEDYLHGDISALGLLTADHGWADDQLGELYGMSSGLSSLTRVEFPSNSERGGLFTTSAFAMITAKFDGVSLVKRGKYVRDVVLCDAPDPPPAGVPMPAADVNENPTDALRAHAEEPVCQGCHQKMDPIGLGLERFDGIGRLRDEYPNGDRISAEGFVDGLEPGTFSGGRELGALLAGSDQAARCFVQKAAGWITRRTPTQADPELEAWAKAFSGSQRMDDLVVAIVTSDTFRYRRTEADE